MNVKPVRKLNIPGIRRSGALNTKLYLNNRCCPVLQSLMHEFFTIENEIILRKRGLPFFGIQFRLISAIFRQLTLLPQDNFIFNREKLAHK